MTTEISIYWGSLIAMLLIVFLAAMGELMSVSYTDAISAFLMLIYLIVAVPLVYSYAGGWSAVVDAVPETHMTFRGGLGTIEMISFVIPSLFLVLGDQNMYQRILAGMDDKKN